MSEDLLSHWTHERALAYISYFTPLARLRGTQIRTSLEDEDAVAYTTPDSHAVLALGAAPYRAALQALLAVLALESVCTACAGPQLVPQQQAQVKYFALGWMTLMQRTDVGWWPR